MTFSSRILLVEDNPGDARLVRELLAEAAPRQFQLHHVDRLEAGLKCMQETRFDLVLLDLALPDSWGMNSLHSILEQSPEAAVIVLTGIDDGSLGIKAVEAGAQDFLAKDNIDSTLLVRCMRYAIERSRLLGAEQAAHVISKTAEQRFRDLVEGLDAVVWEAVPASDPADTRWRYTFVSRRAESVLGYPVEDWLRTPDFPLQHVNPQDLDRLVSMRARIGDRDEDECEYRAVASDGANLWLRDIVRVVRDERGIVVALRGVLIDISHGKQAEAELHASENMLRLIFENVDDIVFLLDVVDGDFRFASVNPRFVGATGLTHAQVVGRSVPEVIPAGALETVLAHYARAIESGKPVHWEEVSIYPTGTKYGEVTVAPVMDGEGRCTQLIGTVRDITWRTQAEQLKAEQAEILAMAAQNQSLDLLLERLARLVEHQAEGSSCIVLLAGADRLLPVAATTLPKEVSQAIADLALGTDGKLDALVLERNHAAEAWRAYRRLMLCHGLKIDASTAILSSEGEPLGAIIVHSPIAVTPPPIHADLLDAASRLASLLVVHARLGERLSHQAQHDALTGLPNRLLFQDRLGQAIHQARRQRHSVAVLFLDLDGFKRINDTLGHSAGDGLIRDVALRLQGVMRHADTLARLGGDEFMVILSDIRHSRDAANVARQLLASLADPFDVAGHEILITASIGISFFPEDAEDAGALQRHADAAMYKAKASGRGEFQCYTSELNAQLVERMTLEGQLRHAAELGQLRLVYQPQRCQDGRLHGFEALLRWHHPQRGVVPPSRFIPVAEESGLIHHIGRWVLEESCRQCAAWRRAGHPTLRMAVNVSAMQFQREGWVQSVASALQQANLDPSGLELELTEGLVMQHAEESSKVLRDIKALGVAIAIDDFGTGYSSLAYLQRLPIDTLKVDQSFIANLDPVDGTQGSSAIVETIVKLAKGLGLMAIAEGVENEAQLAFLHRIGCPAMQGYYLGRPMSGEDCGAYLQQAFGAFAWGDRMQSDGTIG